jgi:hypothetical protein
VLEEEYANLMLFKEMHHNITYSTLNLMIQASRGNVPKYIQVNGCLILYATVYAILSHL